MRRFALLRTALCRKEQERVSVRVGHHQLHALPRRLAGHPNAPLRQMLGVRTDIVDRDADPQGGIAPQRLPALEPNSEPVAPDLAGGPFAGDLQESERLIELETAGSTTD
jgi:hypothetical protein